jgi:hypothetical protein
MDQLEFAPVASALLICICAFIHGRLLCAIQPKRLELARRGTILLASSELTPEGRSYVRFLLDHSFGMAGFLILEAIAIPVVALLVLFRMRLIKKMTMYKVAASDALRLEFIELERLHKEIARFNNPVLQTIVDIEYSAFIPLAIVIRTAILGSAMTVEKYMIPTIVEKLLRTAHWKNNSNLGAAAR